MVKDIKGVSCTREGTGGFAHLSRTPFIFYNKWALFNKAMSKRLLFEKKKEKL